MKEVHAIVAFPQGHTRKPQGRARGRVRATAGPGLPLVVWDLPGGKGRQTMAGGCQLLEEGVAGSAMAGLRLKSASWQMSFICLWDSANPGRGAQPGPHACQSFKQTENKETQLI